MKPKRVCEFKGRGGNKHFGLVAQDLQKVFLEAVSKDASGMLSVGLYCSHSVPYSIVQELNELVNDPKKGQNDTVPKLGNAGF